MLSRTIRLPFSTALRQSTRCRHLVTTYSTSTSDPSSSSSPASSSSNHAPNSNREDSGPAEPGQRERNLTPAEYAFLDKAVRVDQAGELAANWIYRGQAFVLGRDPLVGRVIHEMWDQEKHHLRTMNALQLEHNTRPTALWEVAKVAGWGLGAVTALMGREAAMACTEAVETEIGEHYDDQLRGIHTLSSPQQSPPHPVSSSHSPSPALKSFAQTITQFRDDELEHLDTAVAYHSQRAPAHALLSAVIGAGCKVAIGLCERV